MDVVTRVALRGLLQVAKQYDRAPYLQVNAASADIASDMKVLNKAPCAGLDISQREAAIRGVGSNEQRAGECRQTDVSASSAAREELQHLGGSEGRLQASCEAPTVAG